MTVGCVFASHPWGLYVLAAVGFWHLLGIPPLWYWRDKMRSRAGGQA